MTFVDDLLFSCQVVK